MGRPSHLLLLLLSLPFLPASVHAQAEADFSTPRRAMRFYLVETRAGRYDSAAAALDLSAIPAADRDAEGPQLAQQLAGVLDQALWVDLARLSDAPGGSPDDGPLQDLVGEIPLDGRAIPLLLARQPDGTWKVAVRTLAAVPELDRRYGGSWLNAYLPRVFFVVRFLEITAWQWLGLLTFLALSMLLSFIGTRLFERVARRLARQTAVTWDDQLVDVLHGPVRVFLWLVAFAGLVGLLHLAVPARATVTQLLRTGFAVVATWVGLRLTSFIAHTVETRLTEGVKDPAVIGGVQTQVRVLRRVFAVVVGVVGAALVLMQFEVARNVGASLLASAGVAGIVLGLAAQRSISMLLAGIQLSLTQPIRIGDTVVVENEWGWIEEITLTYVVVRVWDLRRLVVPITRFLELPFQNWTKVSPDILGTVFVYADYAVPVDKLRGELTRLVTGHPKWDGKACSLLVTDSTDRTLTMRAVVSSSDAGKNFDLRCEVREKLIAFLRELDGGRYLPRTRIDVTPSLGAGSEAGGRK